MIEDTSEAWDGGKERPPLLLVIDDTTPVLPESVASAWRVSHVKSLRALDDYLRKVDPADPPLAALVDVNLYHDPGLAALYRLRVHSSTQRTVPILFTSTALARGQLHKSFGLGDLHTLLCALACRTGILICAKDHDNDDLARSLNEIHRIWRRLDAAESNLVGVPHGDLRFVRPIAVTTSGAVPRKSLIRVLLGNEAKRNLWEFIDSDSGNVTSETVNNALKRLLKETRPKPSFTLEGAGTWGRLPPDPLRQFVQGEIGRVALAWQAANSNFLDPSVTRHGVLALPDNEGYAKPGEAFTSFAGRYSSLLAHLDVGRFAIWYLDQPGAE